MKTYKKILSFMLILTLMLTNFSSTVVNAADVKSRKITVYDGTGQYVGEFDSVEEFKEEFLAQNNNSRGLVTTLLTVAAAYGVISMFIDIHYVFTGVDIKTWVRENVVVPFTDELKEMELYSVSGGITNPYPPNSYQHSQFNKTNYYWVVLN